MVLAHVNAYRIEGRLCDRMLQAQPPLIIAPSFRKPPV
jgi:hypothetical protein